jgi:hypothetical protein
MGVEQLPRPAVAKVLILSWQLFGSPLLMEPKGYMLSPVPKRPTSHWTFFSFIGAAISGTKNRKTFGVTSLHASQIAME